MACDNDMDLTNLNTTESHLSEIELLRLELKKEEEITNELESKINNKSEILKARYERKKAEIEKLSCELDNLKRKHPDHCEMDNQLELLNMKKKMDELVAKSEETIENLEAKLSDCINSEQLEPGCSKLNISDNFDLIEENNNLKINYNASCEKLNSLETKKIELTNQISSLETELLELRKSHSECSQAAAVSNDAYEEKLGEKALLLATLNQPKPLSELNEKGSLYDDVKNSYKLVSDNYKSLKNRYEKAKEMLAKNNASIKQLTADKIKLMRTCKKITDEKLNADAELKRNRMERIKDLKESVEKLMILKKGFEGKKPQEISKENFVGLHHFAHLLQEEEKINQVKFKNMLQSKITLQLKMSTCHRELESHVKLLSTKTDANIELKKQLEQLQDKEAGKEKSVETPLEVNTKKSVRFSEKNVKDESQDN